MLSYLRDSILSHWKNILLLTIVYMIIYKYADLFKHILESSQLASCVNNDEATMQPCKQLLGIAGGLLGVFGFISIILLIFKEQRDVIIKVVFTYFSAVTILYTSGIGYTDIEQQKVQFKLNKEYFTAMQENEVIKLLQTKQNKLIEDKIKLKELELSRSNRERYFKVLQEEAKLYLQYRVTAAFAMIVLSYALLLVLFLQLDIGRFKISLIFLIIFFLFSYPAQPI